jgi:hypothetical protein
MIMGNKTVYNPTCTDSPATVAYAMALGITTAAVIVPATRSNFKNSFE